MTGPLRGIAAAPGAVAAAVYLYAPDEYDIDAWLDGPEKAADRLASALADVADAFADAASTTSGEAAEILHAQSVIAADPALRRAAESLVQAGEHPARAVLAAGEQFASTLEHSGNAYLSARANDVRHICDAAARQIADAPPRRPPQPNEPCVLVADDLMPADTATLDPCLVRGIVTEHGSRTSHTSVIARSLGIPAVVGLRGVCQRAAEAGSVAIDGTAGEVIFDPDDATLARIAHLTQVRRQRRERLRQVAGGGATATTDGRRIEVAANVAGVEELSRALADGAEGVGLLRTELLYRGRHEPPSEAEQIARLRAMRELLGPRRLLVRTFDIGADKQVPFLPIRPERNPELGLRGIRLAQAHPELLDTQLHAIAQVAGSGPTAVMAPMVATVEEACWFRERTQAAGMPPEVEGGVMVEVPALATTIGELAPHVDFVSIGTNDLAQYLFAADRRDEMTAQLLDPFALAVLRTVGTICRGMAGHGWVGVCGEAASDPAWALLAVGLGVTELSMQAVAVPEVRAAIISASYEDCRLAAMTALGAGDAAAARGIGLSLVKEPA